jgi:ATP adenylyltransferase
MPTQHLWAPWRMEYVLGKRNEPCIFCAFPARDTRKDDLVLCVREHAFACLNLYPFANGHVLVAPRRHVSALEELSRAEYEGVTSLLREACVRIKKAVSPGGLNVGFNLGKAAGAGIADHLHAHIVPRWEGDLNFMPVVADVRVMPEYLAHTWERLRPSFADLDEEPRA